MITRRKMLKAAPLSAAAFTLAPGLSISHPLTTPETNEDTQNMHLSLAAYSVRQALTRGDMDLFGFIEWCAELGLPGTELTSYYFEEGFDTAYLHRLKRHALANGVTVSGTAIRNDFCLPPGPDRQRQVDEVKRWVDYAVELFAPHIRIFAGDIPNDVDKQTCITWVADAIKDVLDYAGERGILIGLENHGGITGRAADHLAICAAVGDHPWFGINLDTGNYRTDAYEELALAAPHAVNVQIKVEIFENNGTKVPADLERIKQILVDADYKGWVALEYEAEPDPFVEIPRYVETLKALF